MVNENLVNAFIEFVSSTNNGVLCLREGRDRGRQLSHLHLSRVKRIFEKLDESNKFLDGSR